MADFSNYELAVIKNDPRGVYSLADGLIPEIAAGFELELSDLPTQASMTDLVGAIAPNKTLQDNIAFAKEKLGQNAESIAITWVQRSGLLKPILRSFVGESVPAPTEKNCADLTIITGGVARWMLRRAEWAVSEHKDHLSKVYMPVGNRKMGQGEHQLVAAHQEQTGATPTESEFAEIYIAPILRSAGVSVEVLPVASNNGEEVFASGLADKPEIMNSVVLVVGNAPSTAFTAGQFRRVIQDTNTAFDAHGDQVIMTGDGIPVAMEGEGPETHQNPYSALGQIVRTALTLHQNSRN